MEEPKEEIIDEETNPHKQKKRSIFERLTPEKVRELDEETKQKILKKSEKIAWLVFIVALAICAIIFSKYTLIAFNYVKKEILSYKTASILKLIVQILKHLLAIFAIMIVCTVVLSVITTMICSFLEYKFMYESLKKICIVYIIETLEFIWYLGIIVLSVYFIIKFLAWFVTTKGFSVLIKIIFGIIVIVGIYFLLFKCEVVHYKKFGSDWNDLEEEFRMPVWAEVLIGIVFFIILYKKFG